jgi:acetolactate synthase-1/2/3 large subunit
MATVDLNSTPDIVAQWVARFLKARGVDRVFGLQGGHIQPVWDHVARLGIRIVDVRDEGAAVHMAHAHAELTGQLGVCMATAGPGVTNCVTGMANASLARAPVLLIGGCTSRPQANMGPLQDIPHVDILRPVCRQARTLRVADQVVRELDEAVARAFGDLGEPGPVYLEIPTDVLRTPVPPNLVLDDWMRPRPPRLIAPDPAAVAQAVDALWSARRPLVITGRGARGAGATLVRLLDACGAVYLDTQESRGLVPAAHPAFVGAMRAAAMAEADTVLVIGRKLDYQLGYGSPAVFPNARFLRLADTAGELVDNRRGEPEILATPSLALAAMVEAAGNRPPRSTAPGPRGSGAGTRNAAAAARAKRWAATARCIRRRSSTRSRRWPQPTSSPSPTAATS